jgi:FkbM family methyltransferase
VSADLRSLGGLARSLVVYRARPWKTAALARLYAGIVAPGDLAFDVGAHAGNRTRALVQAGARVVALEPQRLFHAWLARDLPAGVTLLRLAVGRAPGRARLAVSRLHPTVSSLAEEFPERMRSAPGFGGVRWDAAETVEVTTLDALIAAFGRPRFVKIDVEGYEAEVLAGLSQPLPWLALEYLPDAPEVAAACVERLAALGDYAFNLVVGETAAFALPRWVGPEAIGAALASARRSGDLYARRADA